MVRYLQFFCYRLPNGNKKKVIENFYNLRNCLNFIENKFY
jgi:hypothetical protein